MAKKKEIKPKHSLHANRSNVGNKNQRSAATVRRLKMYNCRPQRDVKGKVIRVEFGSKDLPNTRIQPDRRWFPPTRTITQKQLEEFREEVESRLANNYNVILNQNKLPMSLLKNLSKQKRAPLLDTEPVEDVFEPKVKCANVDSDCQALLRKAETSPAASVLRVPAKLCTELHKIIESSDVIIQVLDARDPQGTRCYHLEKYLKEKYKHKRMIILLNKCDLTPVWATKGWITALTKEYPTLAFHANITKPFGKDSLLSVLRQLAKLKSDKTATSVGLIGYPNVGKSSVISTFRTKDVAPTIERSKILQFITLAEEIFLIDCPGVVYPDTDSQTDLILKGLVQVKNLQDAGELIREVLIRVKKEYLERAYKIKDWKDENDFVAKFCHLTGKLLKNGEPDLMTAANMVLNDWQSGKIPFFVPPSKSRRRHQRRTHMPLNDKQRRGNQAARFRVVFDEISYDMLLLLLASSDMITDIEVEFQIRGF